MEKLPIALLIGSGSRTPDLYAHLDQSDARAEIVSVISHKALPKDSEGKPLQERHVIGVKEAAERGIPWAYFNLAQMRKVAQEVDPQISDEQFRADYFRILGAFLTQKYPVRPRILFMLGWDIIVSEEFLKYFPSEVDGIYNVVNLHPAQLPDNPEDKIVKLSSGIEIPVLKGEHDEVINEALRLKLPTLGACMHLTVPEADKGGYIIKRAEVHILEDDTLESYDQRLKIAECKLVVEVVDLFAEDRVKIEDGKVKIV